MPNIVLSTIMSNMKPLSGNISVIMQSKLHWKSVQMQALVTSKLYNYITKA